MSIPLSQTLRTCELFQGFSENGLSLVAQIARERSFPINTPLFVENMVADAMFIVKMGIVRLSIRSDRGQELVLGKLTTLDFFGELSLLIGGKRMVTATAETQCEVVEISRREFVKLQNQKPQACLKLMINIVKKFGNNMSVVHEYMKPLLTSQFCK